MKNKSLEDTLKDIYLFSGMNHEEMKDLIQICSLHKYKKNSYLFMKGDASTHLLVLIEGIVSIFKHDNKGNEITIGLFSPVSLLAEPAILKGIPFPSSALFKTEGLVVKIEIESFKKLFLHASHVSYVIIESLLEKIQLLQNNIHLNIEPSAKEKILSFYEKNSKLSVDLKQYEIASLLGMTPETFSRNIKQLTKDNKLIKTKSGYKKL